MLWGLLDDKDKGKGCAKPRDGDPRQHGPRGISFLPRKSEAEEKERRFDEKERPPLPRLSRKLEADKKERRLDKKYRQQGYYDDHDQFRIAPSKVSKAASRPRQAHREWKMKFGANGPRYGYAPPNRC